MQCWFGSQWFVMRHSPPELPVVWLSRAREHGPGRFERVDTLSCGQESLGGRGRHGFLSSQDELRLEHLRTFLRGPFSVGLQRGDHHPSNSLGCRAKATESAPEAHRLCRLAFRRYTLRVCCTSVVARDSSAYGTFRPHTTLERCLSCRAPPNPELRDAR